ncbi:unknown [Ruminococcus sp. CAG:403]|nr:unknown [Ruminococcus sp. CAG:403]
MPPPVLPAQAPISISMTRMVRDSSGHKLKSKVENPVVVMTDPTVKAECSKVCCVLPNRCRML